MSKYYEAGKQAFNQGLVHYSQDIAFLKDIENLEGKEKQKALSEWNKGYIDQSTPVWFDDLIY